MSDGLVTWRNATDFLPRDDDDADGDDGNRDAADLCCHQYNVMQFNVAKNKTHCQSIV